MEGGFIRLTDNPNTMSLKAGGLVELKCNRALVFMSTRALMSFHLVRSMIEFRR